MKLTRGTDYGIRGMMHLAKQPFEQVTLLRDIAQHQDVPESYLAKLFQDLNKAGLIRSHRGAKGGFSLGRPAGEITLREVIEALQGPISLNRCLDIREGCPNSETCAVSAVLRRAQEQLLQSLDAATLAVLVEKAEVLEREHNHAAA